MRDWEEKSLASQLPKGIDTLVSSVTSITNGVAPIADAFKSVAEFGSNLQNTIQNPGYGALLAVANDLKSQIEDLKQFELTWLILHPFIDGIGTYNRNVGMYTLTPSKMLEHIVKKLDDTNDPTRPGGSSGGFVGLVAASDLSAFQTLINGVSSFLQFKELDVMKRSMDEIIALRDGFQRPLEPRFKPKSISTTLPLYSTVFEQMEGLANNVLSVANGASSATELLIKKLETKIEKLSDIGESIKTLTDAIDAAKETNINWLYVAPKVNGIELAPKVNGIELLKEAILNSDQQPSDDLKFCFSFTGLGSGEALEMFASIFGLT